MSDYEQMKNLFNLREIGFEEGVLKSVIQDAPMAVKYLSLTNGEQRNVIGYIGFNATFYFDSIGALISVGVWE